MPSIQITYAGCKLHELGVVQYGAGIEPDQADTSARLIERFRVRLRFFEESFADNEARWKALKVAMRASLRGALVIADDGGIVLESRTARFAGVDGDPEWGEFRREVTLTFEVSGGTGISSGFSASYSPSTGGVVVLPNVASWNGEIKNDRFTTHATMRREGIESVTASGSWAPDATVTDVQKRNDLLDKKTLIESVANCPDGTLTYGTWTQAGFQMESAAAEITGITLLTWRITATRRVFPDGTFGQADYTVEPNDDLDQSKRGFTVAGKIVAETGAHADALAETIRASYATGRVYAGGSKSKRVVDGVDGSDPCVELNFSFRYRETLDVVSWRLKVAGGTDTRTGDLTTIYSGNVTALNLAAALAKARALGGGQASGALLLLAKQEDANTQQTGAGAATAATAILTSDNTNVADGAQVVIGNKTFTFRTALTPLEGEVLIGADADGSLLNLIRAINHTGTPNTDYQCAAAHAQVTAAAGVTAHAVILSATLVPGSAGNVLDSTETSAHLSFGGLVFSGGLDAGPEFISVDFSYTYLGKSAVKYAEIQSDNSEDYFGANTTTVSGYVTAADKATAITFARTFRLSGVLLYNTRESDGKMVNDDAGSEHFQRVDFTYTFGRTVTHTSIGYGMQVSHDYPELTTQIVFSGTAYGPNTASCDALIDLTVGTSYGTASRKLTDSRTKNVKRDSTQALEVFTERPFNVVWTLPISASDASDIDILEAAYTITKRYGFWRAVIDEIPYGVPWVQEDVARTCGSISISGTVKARNVATARTFARDKYNLLSGYLSAEPEEGDGVLFWPMNGTDVKYHTFSFSYQAKDPALVWPL